MLIEREHVIFLKDSLLENESDCDSNHDGSTDDNIEL